jgi:hypothetical protein
MKESNHLDDNQSRPHTLRLEDVPPQVTSEMCRGVE